LIFKTVKIRIVNMKILDSGTVYRLKLLHKSSRDSRVCDRIRCVLLAADGWNASMIAKSQLIDETTVRRHLNDWLNEEKLKPENGGTQSHLSETQTAELIAYLTDNLLPTTAAIINVIEEWWGIVIPCRA
jgi:transposase